MTKFITLTTTEGNVFIEVAISHIRWLLEQHNKDGRFLYTNVQLGGRGVYTQVKESVEDIKAAIQEVEFDVIHEHHREVH